MAAPADEAGSQFSSYVSCYPQMNTEGKRRKKNICVLSARLRRGYGGRAFIGG